MCPKVCGHMTQLWPSTSFPAVTALPLQRKVATFIKVPPVVSLEFESTSKLHRFECRAHNDANSSFTGTFKGVQHLIEGSDRNDLLFTICQSETTKASLY